MPQNQVVSIPWCLVLYLRELWGLEGTQFTLLLAAGILICVVAAYLLGSISTSVSGSGSLTDVDLEEISVPAGVEITEVVAEANSKSA